MIFFSKLIGRVLSMAVVYPPHGDLVIKKNPLLINYHLDLKKKKDREREKRKENQPC